MAYRPTEKTLAHKAELQQRVLTAAMGLVSNGGFAALTIAGVAADAGIATGAVYKHFESKAHLSAEVFRLAAEREVRFVRNNAMGLGTAGERLARTVKAFAERALNNPRLAFALIAEPVDPAIDEERLRYRLAYAEVFAELVHQGITQQEFALQLPSVSAAALVGVIAEALVGPLTWSVADQHDLESDVLINSIQAFCLRAVGATVPDSLAS